MGLNLPKKAGIIGNLYCPMVILIGTVHVLVGWRLVLVGLSSEKLSPVFITLKQILKVKTVLKSLLRCTYVWKSILKYSKKRNQIQKKLLQIKLMERRKDLKKQNKLQVFLLHRKELKKFNQETGVIKTHNLEYKINTLSLKKKTPPQKKKKKKKKKK